MFNKYISVRIVSAITLLLVIGMAVLVFAQSRLSNQFFSEEFSLAYQEKTLLLASQMYGGIKWKKQKSIEEVYANQTDPEAKSNLSDVLITDADLAPLAQFNAEIYKNVDLEILLKENHGALAESPYLTIEDPLHVTTLASVIDPKKDAIIGYVAMSWSKVQALQELTKLIGMSILTSIAVTLVIVVVLVILLQLIAIRPIIDLKKAMDYLARGDLDTKIPFIEKIDEIGQMAKAVQIFKDNAIEKTQLEKEQESKEKQAEEEKREVMKALAKDFESQVGGLIAALVSAASQLQSTAQNMSKIADEVSNFSQTVASTSIEASSNVNTVAAAMEQMSVSSMEIASQINNARTESDQAAKSADNASITIDNLNDLMSNIGEVVGAIRGIAEQTNLLALNATIEAARAGEAGRGFSVVAEEVKKLATETGSKTDDVEDRIAQISKAVGSSVTAVEQIIGNVSEINNVVTIVSAAAEEQNSTNKEINRGVSEASDGVKHVSVIISDVQKGANESKNAADAVLHAANELASISDRLSESVDSFLRQIS